MTRKNRPKTSETASYENRFRRFFFTKGSFASIKAVLQKFRRNWSKQKGGGFRNSYNIVTFCRRLENTELSNFQYPAIFSSEFSVLPQKSSAYLRADSPSGANSRILRGYPKILDARHLHTTIILSAYEKHCLGMR